MLFPPFNTKEQNFQILKILDIFLGSTLLLEGTLWKYLYSVVTNRATHPPLPSFGRTGILFVMHRDE